MTKQCVLKVGFTIQNKAGGVQRATCRDGGQGHSAESRTWLWRRTWTRAEGPGRSRTEQRLPPYPLVQLQCKQSSGFCPGPDTAGPSSSFNWPQVTKRLDYISQRAALLMRASCYRLSWLKLLWSSAPKGRLVRSVYGDHFCSPLINDIQMWGHVQYHMGTWRYICLLSLYDKTKSSHGIHIWGTSSRIRYEIESALT